MSIYLDSQTRTYLERKFKVVAETDFIGKRIQDMLASDRETMESRRQCKHEFDTYLGVKMCCVRCGGFDVGMGKMWQLRGITEPDQPSKHKAPDAINKSSKKDNLK